MNKLGMFATGCLAGLVFTVAATKTPVRTLSISALASATTSFIACLIVDTRKQLKLNDAEERANTSLSKLQRAEGDFNKSQETISGLNTEISKMKDLLSIAKKGLENYESDSEKSRLQIADLVETVNTLGGELHACKQELEEKKTSLEEIEEHFDAIVHEEAQKIAKQYEKTRIQEVFNEHDEITSEAMRLFKQLQGWGQKVRERHETLKESAKELRRQYAKHIDEYTEKVTREREALLHQIEVLNERIALLQHQLNGDLVEPEYGQFGYQWDARIADDIARHIWSGLHIPLAVKGYRINSDGSADGGYGYGRQSPEALIRDLSRISDEIATALGIHAISSIQKHELSDLLIISWRRERPKPISEDAFYRLVEPASACTKLIREAMNHRKGGKPTLRIMGATGEGKGIIAKVLLADWVKNESGEVWLSDPMDGSDEDRWEVPKVAKSAHEARELLKQFKQEFTARKDKQSPRKEIHVLGLFDEFDKEHPRDDKDLVKSIWTAIRHHNMRLVLMGQSSEVGTNGWQWDEMKNCACLFVGSGITTAIKHAKDLGLSRATASQLETQNDQIMNWLESKNQGLDAANQYRVGLLVCGDKARFIEFPSAHKGVIESGLSSIVSRPWESVNAEQKPSIAESRACPGCGGKLRKAGSKLRCENSEHSKEMGKKTFDLNC